MNNALVSIKFDPEINFWDIHPHMIYITPFSKLYKTDGGGSESSKIMWCVAYICHPDEEENKFYRFGREEAESILKETFYPELDTDNPIYNECIDAFPEAALDSVQRALLAKKESLRDRAELLKVEKYTLENSSKLDAMHKNTVKFMEEYDMILEKYINSKRSNIVKGGRSQSKSEKGEI